MGRTPWNVSYVKTILNSRATFGELTPRTGRGGPKDRKPAGPPIPDFYPAAVTEAEFYAAQEAIRARKVRGGRPSKFRVNLFAGLLHDARSGRRLHMKQYAGASPALVPYEGIEHGSTHVSFPLDAFEDAVLGELKEIDAREILPREDRG